ncbi:uncharacterized protein Dwil_GK19228 [Drosophila willistoni]|uniref:Amine oxidase domain-containing protein n=1 Tax=Drosophila willistoni TaxID=7260 RepID=B4N6K3_DROWI|nr:spermine oxidase [Drosophila willistoni]EDW79992.1 uncharacterized protein Dwil_GK19228 [Drosophila willistoni]
MSKTKETARVVIIGAGASGIAAGTRLLEQGFRNVLLLEAEDRIGGRICSIPFADSLMDLGAQWCHGEKGNVVYEFVKDLNFLERTGDYYKNVQFVRSNKDKIVAEQSKIFIEIAENSIPNKNVEFYGTEGDYVKQKYWQEINEQKPSIDNTLATEFLESFLKYECSVDGCDNLFEVSNRNHKEFIESDGDNLLHWRDKGYRTFLRLLMDGKENQPNDLGKLNGRVLFNRRIAEIKWSQCNELILRCWNGEIIQADHIICTVSLGVLKEQHSQLFVPPLPRSKVRAIEGLKLGTVDKFVMEFQVQPLPADCVGFNFLWLQKDLQEIRSTEWFWLESVGSFHRVSHQPRLLEGWITGQHARHMETLTEEKVLEGLLWLFGKFLCFNIPEPKRFIRTQWHANPNFRGSYSFRTTLADDLNIGPWDLEAPIMDSLNKYPKLQFAGEASSKTHFGTVNGATETGWREADRLSQCYTTT